MQKNKVGRPSKKNGFIVQKIMELAREGKTNMQIADIVGISFETLRTWKIEDWEFAVTLNENKFLADQMVEASTFKNAIGYDYYEEVATDQGVVEIRKHKSPNPSSQIFWLKNRRPDDWRDNPHYKEEAELEERRKTLLALPKEELIKRAEQMVELMKKAKKEDDSK